MAATRYSGAPRVYGRHERERSVAGDRYGANACARRSSSATPVARLADGRRRPIVDGRDAAADPPRGLWLLVECARAAALRAPRQRGPHAAYTDAVVGRSLEHRAQGDAPPRRRGRRHAGAIIRPRSTPNVTRRSFPMKAIRVHAPGAADVMKLEDVPEPQPKAGEAMVKVDAAGLNYIDVYQRSGLYKLQMPLTLGLEAGGTVTAVGS